MKHGCVDSKHPASLLRLSRKPVVFDLDACCAPLAEIKARAARLATADDHSLREASERLKGRARAGAPPDDLLVEAYGLVREAAHRALGLLPFDVQVMAGIAMHRGHIAEMQTGEGKTLVAVFPAYLHALAGRGVHVLTFNDYLARRDAAWMEPVYRLLGMTVGSIRGGMPGRARRRAYAADVTYATAKEAGFDFLRDHRCYNPDFQTDAHGRNIYLTEAGINRIDHSDVIFTDKEAKNGALIAEIARVHETGRPVLVGTGSVAESEDLAAKLQKAGVPCRALNAKNDALEARIIARAGAAGAVTISTNMAGRGTDIKLGGDLEQERDRVVALGGLYVLGTNRHKSLRIDQQLRIAGGLRAIQI